MNGAESSWSDVGSGIPQGSILGPLIFILYINDLPEEINSSMLLFADDTKIFKEIKNVADQISLQNDINKMYEWSQIWLLKFHPDKCKSMRIGPADKNKVCFNYNINGHVLEYTKEEKDLGVIIDSDLSFEAHISSKVNKANSIMGLIRRSFTHLDKSNFSKLFKALVRPHLEYANAAWHPITVKCKGMIENVQRRATKFLPCCSGLEYEDCLKNLDLPCLAYRKLRGDMIEAYKMMNEHYDNQITPPIQRARDVHTRETRGRDNGLHKTIAKNKTRHNFFRNRVVNFWNELPEKVKQAPSINSFKNRLDRFWKNFNIKFSYEECLNFERQRTDPKYVGTNNRNMYTYRDADLEIQDT